MARRGQETRAEHVHAMFVDPLRLAIALVPVAAYVLLLGLVNLRRRPFLTSGGCDLTALGIALSGLMFIGPMDLLRPEAATRSFGNFAWLFLLLFYWLWLLLAVLLSRPRLVIYNISAEELHSALAGAAGRLDPAARWAGNQLSLPGLGIQLHLDSFGLMRNTSLVSSGGRQNIDGWRRLAQELSSTLKNIRVKPNPRSVGFLTVSVVLLAMCVALLVVRQEAVLQAMNQIFAY
jgi:hypothetical protein